MKKLLLLILTLASFGSFGQPNPQESYPERIKTITEQLKTDPQNYGLIWERLKMKVNLMGNFGLQDEVFSINADSIAKTKERGIFFAENNTDFDAIYKNIIKEKKYDIVEEGDFYLNRIWFYFNCGQIDKAIQDAKYLRDSASYSRYWQRGGYYNDWATYSLFNLHVIKKQYPDALEAIEAMLEKKKKEDPKEYYSGHGSFLSYRDKIRLFEHFGKEDKIIPFLRANCKEHFAWYLENAKDKDYSTETAKQQSLYTLKELVGYMDRYNDKEFPKYQKIYNQLRHRINENYEIINPDLGDDELGHIISAIK